MSNKVANKKRYEEKVPAGIILSILAAGIVPLIMRTFTYDSHLSGYEWFPSDGTVVDIFLAYKSFAMITIGVCMAIALAYRAYDHEKFPLTRLFKVLFIYAALVLISGLASKWKGFAFGGSYEMFESVLVVLCYVMFAFYTFTDVKNEKTVKTLLKWVGIFALILMLIGVFQGFGADLFATKFGKVLFSTPSFWSNLDNLIIRMPKGTSYSTLYNPNFFSLYLALVLPMAVAAFFAVKEKKARILSGAIIVCSVILLVTDISITGVMSLVISGIVTLLVVLSRRKKQFVTAFSLVMAVIVIGIIMCIAVKPVHELFLRKINADPTPLTSGTLKDIETNTDNVTLDLKDGTKCVIEYAFDDSGSMTVTAQDGDENDLTVTWNGTSDDITDPDGKVIASVIPKSTEDGQNFISISIDTREFYFIQDEDGYEYVTGSGKLVKLDDHIKTADVFPEDFFSNRGIIWNRTLPLLPKHIILGSGQNTFLMVYPQNNYVMKSLLIESETTSIDVKPHNLYLQQWVENGLIALILYLIVVIGYLVQTASVIRHHDIKKPMVILSIGAFAGILAHMAAGIANDSNVCTSPVMWVLLGLGFAINEIIKHEDSDTAGNA
ncbi:MAG: O-antigen ligase family protein [Lachnospiraceae bacterium]|nr:O-antigen ligase family protein [Lachnospiraceae bacterium]